MEPVMGVCEGDMFLNLDFTEPFETNSSSGSIANAMAMGRSHDLFDNLMLEMDMDFGIKDEDMLLGDRNSDLNDLLLSTLSPLEGLDTMTDSGVIGDDAPWVKLEATIAEEVERYKEDYTGGSQQHVLNLEEVSTPISTSGADSIITATEIPVIVEDAQIVTQVPRKRQQTTKPKLFACHLCTSTFTARFNLNKHIRTVHENLRPFHCDVCGASFQQKCHLKQHKTTVHEHKRPYKCEICELSFGWPAVLNKHIRLKHEKQRPFSCTVCPRTFQQKTHLTQHMIALHEKKKPFSCDHCDMTFNRKERMKKHLQVAHDKIVD